MVRQILFVTFMVRIFKKIGKHWLDPDKIKYIYPFLATNIDKKIGKKKNNVPTSLIGTNLYSPMHRPREIGRAWLLGRIGKNCPF